MGLTSETEIRRKVKEVPVTYLIFDVMWQDGHSLLKEAYVDRRKKLEALKLNGASWQTPPYEKGGGPTMVQASRKAGLEGTMAKRLDSPYEPGKRSGVWQKLKNRMGQELVIAGWLQGQGQRRGDPGALLVGYYDNGEFVYAGKVGTGFTDEMLEKLSKLLKPLERKTGGKSSSFDRGTPPKAPHLSRPVLLSDSQFPPRTNSAHTPPPAPHSP